MIHEQEQQATTWQVDHQLNTTDVDVNCWIIKHEAVTRIIPKTITMVDDNKIQLTFLRPCTGQVQVTRSTRWQQFNK